MSFVRASLVAAVVVGVAVGRLASTPTEIPHRGSLDDLRSDAAYLLDESDGVYRVERLVAVDLPRRRHRIIQIADLHPVSFDDLADDLLDQDATVSDEDVRQEYLAIMAAVRRVQRSQRALIRWLGKYHGVDRVFLEGLTDENLPAYLTIVRALGRADASKLPPQFGAAAQSLLIGDLKGIVAAEDEAAYARADPFAGDDIAFKGAANDAREAAIVRWNPSDQNSAASRSSGQAERQRSLRLRTLSSKTEPQSPLAGSAPDRHIYELFDPSREVRRTVPRHRR